MDINDAVCTSIQAGLDEIVILAEVVSVQVTAQVVVKQELPAGWETEDVHVIIVGEMCHLVTRGFLCELG